MQNMSGFEPHLCRTGDQSHQTANLAAALNAFILAPKIDKTSPKWSLTMHGCTLHVMFLALYMHGMHGCWGCECCMAKTVLSTYVDEEDNSARPSVTATSTLCGCSSH
jgi:hypothetical protein